MAGKLLSSLRLYLRQEPGRVRWQRMWICALIGVTAATIFSWTMSTINLVTLPHQHLGMNWPRLWFYWGGLCMLAGIEGFFVGWFTENYEAISFGWMPVEFMLLLSYFIYLSVSSTDTFTTAISIIGLLEITGALIFLAAILRLIANKLIQNYYSPDKAGRWKRILPFVLGISFLLILTSSLARYDISIVMAIRSFNDSMARMATDTTLESRLPLDALPELRSHIGEAYKIYPRPDTEAVGMYVFSVVFPDGFSFSCRVSVTETRRDFYFADCYPGGDLSFP